MRVLIALIMATLAAGPAWAQATPITNRSVPIYAVDTHGIGVKLGTVEMKDVPDGLRIKLDLEGLPPGPHGFHVHTVSDCAQAENGGRIVPAGSAGAPYDPFRAGRHAGPHGSGYLGDLPFISAGKDGKAKYVMTAPRLKVDDLRNRSVLITVGGDNYTDTPPMGGGGDAIACGAIR
ncbi:MAG: superoxide dismutase family protein [Rhodospirillales bacterium]